MNESLGVTLRDVAKAAGVGLTTVSLALRDHPKISAATRERVKAVAERMGYRPNPLLTAYQQQVRSRQARKHQATIAWISDYTHPAHWHAAALFKKAQARCQDLGYLLDEIHFNGMERPDDPEYNVNRFLRVMRARGIFGALLPPLCRPNLAAELWQQVAVVLIGHYDAMLHTSKRARTLHTPYHQVAPDCGLNTWRAVEALRERGKRRIGLVITDWWDQISNQASRSRMLIVQDELPPAERVPPLLFRTDGKPFVERHRDELLAWFDQHRPEAVLCVNREVRDWLRAHRGDQPTVFAHLSAQNESPDWPGMDECDDRVAIAAVDLLSSHMLRNERGVPAFPKRVLIPGIWRDAQ
jgi:DNA-binding LacI/PurR family transcriptional regulator